MGARVSGVRPMVITDLVRLGDAMLDSRGLLYSDTWRTLHPKRCGSTQRLKVTEHPSYDFAAGEDYDYDQTRGVVAWFGSFDEAKAFLDAHRPGIWKVCRSCEALDSPTRA